MTEFEEYIKNRFEGVEELDTTGPDLMPPKFWESLVEDAGEKGAAQVINSRICSSYPVSYKDPDNVRIEIYHSFAGDIPIIYAKDTEDFESLVTNIVHKGVRPDNISKTGASFLSGKTVRFIILSHKPYSNVPASELGLGEEEWAEKSMILRRSHECTHYFTKKTYGIANNILHDELMADFIGLYDAFGYYRSEWVLRFLGIIEGGGKRLEVYTEGLAPETRELVAGMAKDASLGLEHWSGSDAFRNMTIVERIRTMCRAGLAEIARW